jgi:hypothetical protein
MKRADSFSRMRQLQRSRVASRKLITKGRPRGRPAKYNWDELTKGEIWIAVEGKDFTCRTENFRTYLYIQARQRGLTVKTEYHAGELRFQFRSNND